MTKLIALTKGQFAIVDDADFDWLSQWKWYCLVGKVNLYATRTLKGIRMHRVILNPPNGMVVDHIDGNGLNNQRSNLRVCTQAQNAQNMKNMKGGTSQYKGVYWFSEKSKWRACISADSRNRHLGNFKFEIDAARAYDAAAIQYYGEFACLNFPQEQP